MKAVILAGGKGTRLGELTKEIPKPMLPISGKPLLEYQIEWLKSYNINDIWITVNHLKESILDYFWKGENHGVNIRYYEESEPLGTVGGIKALEKELQEDFIVVYGDIMVKMHLGYLMNFHQQKKSDLTLVVHPNDHPYDSDLVETNSQERITCFHSKPHLPDKYYGNLVNAGVYVMSPIIFDYLELGKKADFGKDIFPKITDKIRMFGYNTSEYLKDMGTPERLKKVTFDLESGRIKRKSYEFPQKAIFLDRDGVINDDTEFIHRPEDFKLYNHTAKAIRKINQSDFLAVVATNQSVVARNLCTEEELKLIHNKMEQDLGHEHAWIDRIYYCPHHPDKGFPEENEVYKIDCECRKPKPGMLIQGAKEYHIDLSSSYMIGDNERDIAAGKAAGCITVGVATGKGLDSASLLPDYFFSDLAEAVDFIIDDPLRPTADSIFKRIDFSKKPFVISIGGNTQSGKSTLATYLSMFLKKQGKSVLKIELDDWILPKSKRKKDHDVLHNFQHEKMVSDLIKILKGGAISTDGYARHPKRNAIPKTYRYNLEDIIIIEGVIALSSATILEVSDLKIFKKIEEAEHKKRVYSHLKWKGYHQNDINTLWAERKQKEYDLINPTEQFADCVF